MDKRAVRKTGKICVVCGGTFLGIYSKMTCSNSCRVHMSRIVARGGKPEFILLAKTKGQKIPDFTKPKKQQKKEIDKPNVDEKTKESKTEQQVVAPVQLSKEQRDAKIAELNKEISSIRREQCPSNSHPKMFKLIQEDRISKLQDEINQLNNN